jgi:GTP-binding protein
MRITSSTFISSSAELKQCPKTDLPEFAFIGRSNVGKSSLINMLTDHKNLAKVSQTPGKTRLINHFNINDTWFLVDLPGYGYAKISKTEKPKLDKMIHDFLQRRRSLKLTFLLIDSRHELLQNDKLFMEWLSQNQIPFVILLTKADKLKRNQLNQNLKSLGRAVAGFNPPPVIIPTSSADRRGKEEILMIIDQNLNILSSFVTQ